jgi:glycosyltransferase involved in cell wall biosynthesis
MRKKLLIISHTEHYLQDGQPLGWGPTITEINYLAQYWEEVVHIACLHTGEAPGSALPYTAENIRFVAIPPYGGPSWKDKLGILLKMSTILRTIRKEIKGASEVQLRVPTGMGVFLLPWFSFHKRTFTLWVKYAGNWAQEKPPLGYAFQRWWLQKNWARCKVTINGKWPNQPAHCLSFENPCLYEGEIEEGKKIAEHKSFKPPFQLLFVGQLTNSKGVYRILEALKFMDSKMILKMVFVGDGPDKKRFIDLASQLALKTEFCGFLGRKEVHEQMKYAHFILLPSDSEGFPKVIAEAACYGVIPVVSAVSSIPHYIKEKHGFLWEKGESLTEFLNQSINTSSIVLQRKSSEVTRIASFFTFQAFLDNLFHQIIKDEG